MKTRTMLIGAAIAAVLSCASVNAQVLGSGSLGGGLGGTLGGGLGGGMNDVNVLTRGAANGTLGADFETGSLRRSTRDVAGRTRDVAGRATSRVRNTTESVRDGATSKLDTAQQTTQSVAASAAATATGAVDTQSIQSAAEVAGSAASQIDTDGTHLTSAADGTAKQDTLIKPELGNPIDKDAMPSTEVPAPSADEVKPAQKADGQLAGLLESRESAHADSNDAPRGLTANSALDGAASGTGSVERSSNESALDFSKQANGSASGDAEASRSGVSARSSASAEGSSSASVSTQR